MYGACIPDQSKSPFRRVVLSLFLGSMALLALGLAGGLNFRNSVRSAAAQSVRIDFDATAQSITQVRGAVRAVRPRME